MFGLFDLFKVVKLGSRLTLKVNAHYSMPCAYDDTPQGGIKAGLKTVQGAGTESLEGLALPEDAIY